MLIERPPHIYRCLFPGALWRIEEKATALYLTFDDGPIPEVTPWVLDVLDCYDAKATFFMVGDNARRHPGLVEEVLRRGHTIGNHTMHHTQGLKTRTEKYLHDVDNVPDALKASRLFRPPHGFIRPEQIRKVKEMGYTVIMHDLVTRDYDPALSSERIFDNVRRYARPGSIAVFHDSIKAINSLKRALPMSLAHLRALGYAFPPLPL